MFIQRPITFQALNLHQIKSTMQEIDRLQFQRSGVVGSHESSARTSDSAALPYKSLSTKYLKTLAARTFNVHEHQCEPYIHIARYKTNQEYQPHHDSCCEDSTPCKDFRKSWGDRIGTFLVY